MTGQLVITTVPEFGSVPVVDDELTKAAGGPSLNMMDVARQVEGPIFVLRHIGEDRLVVHGVDLVADLSDDTRFGKHIYPTLEEMRNLAGDGLFTAYDGEAAWQPAHDVLLPAFGLGALRRYHPVMLAMARRLTDRWDSHVDGAPVDVLADMTRLAMDTIGLTGFGYEFGSFERPDLHPIVTTLLRAMLHARSRDNREPGTGHRYVAEDAQFEVDVAFLKDRVGEVIRARRDSGDTRTDDLLGMMLNAPHQGSGRTLSDDNIRNQVITFLIAGHETTASLLTFALQYLVKNPEVLYRARAEADAMWGDEPDPAPSFENVGRLRYTRQVLNESLRLWPIAPMFSRIAREDTLLCGRYPIHRGQAVRVLVPMLHRDPVWGADVDRFDPDRFGPERAASRPAHAYKPFGTGVRACIGRQFSLHEATLVLALLLHRYELHDHADYQLSVRQVLTFKPDGFTLRLSRRTAAPRAAAAPTRTASTVPAPVAAVPATTGVRTTVTVLSGSNLGTCRSLARRIAEELTVVGFDPVVGSLDGYAGRLPAAGPLVVVAASYNGNPTDDAVRFVAWLRDPDTTVPAGTPFAVLGVGDSNWTDTYQRIPALIDERLGELGADRLIGRGAADVAEDFEDAVTVWTQALSTGLVGRYGAQAGADRRPVDVSGEKSEEELSQLDPTVVPVTAALDAEYGAAPMIVVDNVELSDLTHPLGRSKRHLRIKLPPEVSYRTGDHLMIVVDNDPAVVARAAKVLNLDPDRVLDLRAARSLRVDRPLTVQQLLTHFVELQDVATVAQVRTLAAANPCAPEQQALMALVDGEGSRERFAEQVTAARRSVLDLIETFPATDLSPEELVALLPARRPRHYSISSSALAQPGRVDLLVSVPEQAGPGPAYLSALRPGVQIRAAVQPCREAFRATAPSMPATPLILVGAGSGLAPLRGFIADRVHQIAAGTDVPAAICYFGCDHPDVDYVHRVQLARAERTGAVRMRPAFSEAPVDNARYVQHRILAEADELWQLLDGQQARVYVCGDGARMAPAVRDAFRRIHAERTGADDAASRRWLADLMTGARYVEDVYSGPS